MTVRRTPLQVLWRSAKVVAYIDGRIRVTPVWREDRSPVWTRLYATRQLQRLIDRELRGAKRAKQKA